MGALEHTEAPIVLVVEDDPDVRALAVAIVDESELTTAEAASGEDALAFLRDHAPDVRIALTDFELSGRLDGLDLARVAALRWPWIKVLLTSGGARVHDIPKNVT